MPESPESKPARLPMTAQWDPEKLRREEAFLQEIEQKPIPARIRGYWKLTGPAWMQSAMTLGAGSAVASVVAGASFGYTLLWVQPVAMFLGILMMAALGNIVLSTGERPYPAFARELHPSIAFLWALGSIVASVIWHFPQYGLAGAAIWDLALLAGAPSDSRTVEYLVKFAGGLGILSMAILVTWNYGSGTRGIKLYENFLRWTIRLVILAFLFVVVKTGVDWGALFRGFFTFRIPPGEGTTILVLGAIGAAVGINMTFLYPYSLLAKGWGKHHKGLARFDLANSMFVPFVIVTSLVIIAMANTVYDPSTPGVQTGLRPIDAARSLESLLGSSFGRIILDLGFIGMACGAISTHMVVCGFTGCEMFKVEYTPKRYRRFTLLPAIGVFGVVFTSPLWMPIVASAIALTMLPIAYLAFFVLNNKRSYLGDAVGRGWKRALFNFGMIVAIVFACVASAIGIKRRVIDNLRPAPAATAPAVPPVPPAPTG
ncbi:MAG: divalent metal cation transporter [Verrucomicrobiae bacterium]|nr:divalent metal cation transporter [Verrucomicrobiae bacterium]